MNKKSKYGNLLTAREILDDAWCNLCKVEYKGLIFSAPSLPKILEEIKKLSFKFIILMLNRLVMGALRYGSLFDKGRLDYDMIKRMNEKIKYYLETNNRELLVDISNYALLEFYKRKDDKDYYFKELDNTHKRLDRR